MQMEKQAELLQQHQMAMYEILREFDRVCRTLKITYFLFAGTMLGAVRHSGFIPWDDDLDVIMQRADYERFLAEAGEIVNSEKFFLQKEFSEHWPMFFSKMRMNKTTCLEPYHAKDPQCHQGVYIDIFPCDRAYKSKIGRKIQFYASKIVIAKALEARGYDTSGKMKVLGMKLSRMLPQKPFLKIVRGGTGESELLHGFFAGASRMECSVFPRKAFSEVTMVPFENGRYPIPVGYKQLLEIMYGDYMQLPDEKQRSYKRHSIFVDLNRSYEEYRDYREGMDLQDRLKSIR